MLEPLRRRLVRDPLDLDLPHWIIDEAFDLDFHVRHLGLPPPGDFAQLQTQVARLAARPLDQSRPLWEAYVIDGLPDDRFALFMKMHHATVDGAAGAEMLGRITDTEPGAERPELDVSLMKEPARLVRFQAKMVRDLAESSRNHGVKSVVEAASRAVPGPVGHAVRRLAGDRPSRPRGLRPLVVPLSPPRLDASRARGCRPHAATRDAGSVPRRRSSVDRCRSTHRLIDRRGWPRRRRHDPR